MSQDQIRTLGSYMLPGKVPKFLEIYREATEPNFGYLVIDAKPDTPESERFKHRLFPIKEAKDRDDFQYAVSNQANNTENMVSCDQCGLMFEDIHDLQRHIQNWCPEVPTKRAKLECVDEKAVVEQPQPVNPLTTEAELPIFEEMWSDVEKTNNKLWQRKVDKLVQDGMIQEEAEAVADEHFQDADEDSFFDHYTTLLRRSMRLKDGLIHNKILEAVDSYKKEGYALKHAIRKALRDNWDEIMDMIADDDTESDTSSTTSDESAGSDVDEENIDDLE